MFKRNLLLGLLIFSLGVMMTACGDDNNTTNTTNTDVVDDNNKDFEDENNISCTDCVRSFDGRLQIVNEDLYYQAFGHVGGNDIYTGGNIFNQVITQEILEPVGGLVVCGARVYLTEAIAELMGIQNVDIECTQEDLNLFSNGGIGSTVDLLETTNPRAQLRVRYVDGRARELELTVFSNINNGDDREVFYFDRDGIFINRENTLLIQNSNGRIRFGTTNGQLIGEFQ